MVTKPTRTEGSAEFDKLESGTYKALLEIKDCELKYKEEPARPGIHFKFSFLNHFAFCNYKVLSTTMEGAKLHRVMMDCHNSLLKQLKFVQPEGSKRKFAEDEDLFFELLTECDGKEYMVTIEVKDGWNNYVSCEPAPAVEEQGDPTALMVTADELVKDTAKKIGTKKTDLENDTPDWLDESGDIPF